MKFLTPILFFAAAAYVHWHNTTQTGSVLMFPFIDIVYPPSKGNPHQMGSASVVLLAALGFVTLMWTATAEIRYRRHLRSNMAQKP